MGGWGRKSHEEGDDGGRFALVYAETPVHGDYLDGVPVWAQQHFVKVPSVGKLLWNIQNNSSTGGYACIVESPLLPARDIE